MIMQFSCCSKEQGADSAFDNLTVTVSQKTQSVNAPVVNLPFRLFLSFFEEGWWSENLTVTVSQKTQSVNAPVVSLPFRLFLSFFEEGWWRRGGGYRREGRSLT